MLLKSNASNIPNSELVERLTGFDDLPHWYKVPTHPLVPQSDGRTIWVRYQDLSPSQSQDTYQWSQNYPDPYGPDEEMESKGRWQVLVVWKTKSFISLTPRNTCGRHQ